MAENNDKITKNSGIVVSLLNDDEVKSEMGEAFSSVMINPTVTWAKFVLTDDKTNANGERVPHEEFANIIRSGIHMPVKMALGEISPGHPGTKPLGTITHLKEVQTQDGVNAIVAIAALWGQERPADVEFLKQRFAENKPVDVSWEILYEDATLNPTLSSMDLSGTVLRAATIVGNPAYEGRTQFLSIAAKKKSEATVEEEATDPETNTEEELKTVEELQAQVAELEPKLSEAETKLVDAQAEITRLTDENTALKSELEPLKEFKQSIDAEAAKLEKLDSIKAKFVEAGINKDDTYFIDNEEKLLKMDDDTLEFIIQEAAANLSSSSNTSTASTKKTEIPNLQSTDTEVDYSNPQVLGRLLREQGKKK